MCESARSCLCCTCMSWSRTAAAQTPDWYDWETALAASDINDGSELGTCMWAARLPSMLVSRWLQHVCFTDRVKDPPPPPPPTPRSCQRSYQTLKGCISNRSFLGIAVRRPMLDLHRARVEVAAARACAWRRGRCQLAVRGSRTVPPNADLSSAVRAITAHVTILADIRPADVRHAHAGA